MLLQDFFCKCQTPQGAEKHLLLKSAVHYLHYLKLNTIAQRKTTNNSSIHDWYCLFDLKFSCTETTLSDSKHLLYIMCIYCTNWLKVISCQEQIVRLLVVIYHKIMWISIFKVIKLNLEYQNIKMLRRTYEYISFFSFMRLCSKSASCNRIPLLFLSCSLF